MQLLHMYAPLNTAYAQVHPHYNVKVLYDNPAFLKPPRHSSMAIYLIFRF